MIAMKNTIYVNVFQPKAPYINLETGLKTSTIKVTMAIITDRNGDINFFMAFYLLDSLLFALPFLILVLFPFDKLESRWDVQ